MNRWNIPDWLEREVRDRDTSCVYCRVDFDSLTATRKARATWEHIINDANIVIRENIARCCALQLEQGRQGSFRLAESAYCKKRGITKDAVAEVVRRHLASEQSRLPVFA